MVTIQGAEKVKAVYGEWPSFHDAEVWSLTYQRIPDGFSVIAVIHAFQMTGEVDDRRHFVLKNHCQVRIRFERCSEVSLGGFNVQNVLFELAIDEPEDAPAGLPYLVWFDTSYGLEGSLRCSRVVVEDVEPWSPPCGVYAEAARDG